MVSWWFGLVVLVLLRGSSLWDPTLRPWGIPFNGPFCTSRTFMKRSLGGKRYEIQKVGWGKVMLKDFLLYPFVQWKRYIFVTLHSLNAKGRWFSGLDLNPHCSCCVRWICHIKATSFAMTGLPDETITNPKIWVLMVYACHLFLAYTP